MGEVSLLERVITAAELRARTSVERVEMSKSTRRSERQGHVHLVGVDGVHDRSGCWPIACDLIGPIVHVYNGALLRHHENQRLDSDPVEGQGSTRRLEIESNPPKGARSSGQVHHGIVQNPIVPRIHDLPISLIVELDNAVSHFFCRLPQLWPGCIGLLARREARTTKSSATSWLRRDSAGSPSAPSMISLGNRPWKKYLTSRSRLGGNGARTSGSSYDTFRSWYNIRLKRSR